MVLIDDAGWGSMIGGVIIGVYREETQVFSFAEVPIIDFQGKNFSNKEYLSSAGDIAISLLTELKVFKKEPIKICTGYCLDGIADRLSSEKYNFVRGKITGPLQDKIEHALRTVLECKYGFNVTYDELTGIEKKGLFWWKQISWLKDGNVESRSCNAAKAGNCKTGWATFKAWSELPYSRAKEAAKEIKAQQRRRTSYWRE